MIRSLILFFSFSATCLSCAREPTDPSRSDLTGVWKSFDQDRYIRNIELHLKTTEPGVVIGQWFTLGKVDRLCGPAEACTDSSNIQGRSDVAQVVLHLFGAGDFVGEQTSTNKIKGAIRSFERNYHVTFTRQ